MSEQKPAPQAAGSRASMKKELPEKYRNHKHVWVFMEMERGVVHPVSFELLGEVVERVGALARRGLFAEPAQFLGETRDGVGRDGPGREGVREIVNRRTLEHGTEPEQVVHTGHRGGAHAHRAPTAVADCEPVVDQPAKGVADRRPGEPKAFHQRVFAQAGAGPQLAALDLRAEARVRGVRLAPGFDLAHSVITLLSVATHPRCGW